MCGFWPPKYYEVPAKNIYFLLNGTRAFDFITH
jgi:hypothetical protein